MNIAVTGASGHIGSNLCRGLVNQGHSVRALVHRDVRGVEGLGMKLISGDLMNPKSLLSLVKDVDVVFHLAAIISIKGRKNEIFEKNVEGTRNILGAALDTGVRRFVHFSSIHSLDPRPRDKVMNEDRPLVLNDRIAYSRSKAMAEVAVQDAVKQGLNAVILNPTAVIGPYDFAPSLLGRALILMYRGKLPALIRGGYDWVDVRDVVQSAITVMARGGTGERYILSGHWKSLPELCVLVSRLSHRRPPALTCSIRLAKIGLPFLKIYSRLNKSDPLYTLDSLTIVKTGNKNISHKKATAELDFHPRPLEDTLEDTMRWFKESDYLD
ncbi:MAG: NAD-dependent epimerase/dehydratase family protein [Candidatus Aminicenantes bacterium]|nr:NAD-dependent epimerase/dehydratase family protein [Candidatus Aminicenantes bacterium]